MALLLLERAQARTRRSCWGWTQRRSRRRRERCRSSRRRRRRRHRAGAEKTRTRKSVEPVFEDARIDILLRQLSFLVPLFSAEHAACLQRVRLALWVHCLSAPSVSASTYYLSSLQPSIEVCVPLHISFSFTHTRTRTCAHTNTHTHTHLGLILIRRTTEQDMTLHPCWAFHSLALMPRKAAAMPTNIHLLEGAEWMQCVSRCHCRLCPCRCCLCCRCCCRCCLVSRLCFFAKLTVLSLGLLLARSSTAFLYPLLFFFCCCCSFTQQMWE